MKKLFNNLFFSLPIGPRLLLLIFALGFPVAWLGHSLHAFDLYAWLGLSPARVWHGEVWRMLSYGLLAGGPVDWAVSLFWLVTLLGILGRNWSALEFCGYCSCGILGGALPYVLVKPGMEGFIAGNAALTFALLVAWDWFYRRERLILLGIGEISVRQAVILVAVIDSIILFFCCGGWFFMVAMWGGGVAGWLWVTIRSKIFMGKAPVQIRSERVARLEL